WLCPKSQEIYFGRVIASSGLVLHKKVDRATVFLCGPLRISAFSAFNGNFNAEGRRERSTLLSKTNPDEAMTRPKYIPDF
ncbi:MAG TPA: hypothetical protein VFB70_01035, partial [Pyrinomonadaceae bacterium]|nr:hypothetical protein [Pyrinomonadaceae bacterium]